MAKVLVTGVAGFIGSHTADHLLRAGHRVWGIDNLRTGRLSNIADAIEAGLTFRKFSMLDAVRLNRLVKKERFDAIIHLAALVSVDESIRQPQLNFQLNVEGTHTIAEAARRGGVKRLVFASSAAVYGNTKKFPVDEATAPHPISPYGSAKLASEYLLLSYASAYGMTVRIQRYFNVFGRRQDPSSPYSGVVSIFLERLRQRKPITIYGDGKQTRDFVDVADVARANVLAATKPGVASGVANICTGRATSLLDLLGYLPNPSPMKPLRFGPARKGDIRHSAGSTAAARKALGFKATRTVREGLAELAGKD